MKFSFSYCDSDRIETVELTISDAVIAKAQGVGYDLISVETIARSMVDQFFYRVTATSFWQRSPVLNSGDNDRIE